MKREPHVTDVELGVIGSRATTEWELMTMVRDEYEAARAKDAELIQRLVDALKYFSRDGGARYSISMLPALAVSKALAAAEAEGFKPTEQ